MTSKLKISSLLLVMDIWIWISRDTLNFISPIWKLNPNEFRRFNANRNTQIIDFFFVESTLVPLVYKLSFSVLTSIWIFTSGLQHFFFFFFFLPTKLFFLVTQQNRDIVRYDYTIVSTILITQLKLFHDPIAIIILSTR